MSVYAKAHEFSRPVPFHALQPGALEAVQRMKEEGDTRLAARAVDRIMAKVHTKHGNPRRKDSGYEGVRVTPMARRMLAKAEAAGFTARVHELDRGCMVEGYRLEPEKVGFRAWWDEGSADGASWHEPWRYEMMRDDRPVGVNKTALVALAGKRAAGLGAEHLRIVGTPWGLPIDHTTLGKRLAEYDA